jgi:hypothetical protein
MGRKIYPGRKNHHFGSRKYTYQRIAYHNLSRIHLTQMHKYRSRQSSIAAVETSKPLLEPVPLERGQAPPTRFQVNRPARNSQPSLQEFTVEAEYRIYTAGYPTSPQTNIMKFWEVRSMSLQLAG